MQLHRIAAFVTEEPGGNPAGVGLCDTLPTPAEMQRIAAELGYSETAFAAPGGERRWIVRYFAPESEVPFCGHATIALGAVLGAEVVDGKHELVLAGGEIAVTATQRDGTPYAELLSLPTSNRAPTDDGLREALDLFGFAGADLDATLPAAWASAGATHLIVPLATRAALARMDYDLDAGRAFMARQALTTIAFVWRETERVFHARNAFASGGVLEDPATGAAAAALTGMLRDRGSLGAGAFTVFQGADMGRTSRIDGSVTATTGAPVTIGGACRAMATH